MLSSEQSHDLRSHGSMDWPSSMERIAPQELSHRRTAAGIGKSLLLGPANILEAVLGGIPVERGFWERLRLVNNCVEEAVSVKVEDVRVGIGSTEIGGLLNETRVKVLCCRPLRRYPIRCSVYRGCIHEQEVAGSRLVELEHLY